MRTLVLSIPPYALCVLLGILLFVEWSREAPEPIVGREVPLEAETDTDPVASSDVTDESNDAGESQEPSPKRDGLEVDLARVEKLAGEKDRETVERLSEELTTRYATNRAALTRVLMVLGEAWNRVGGHAQHRAAHLRAGELIEEIRVDYAEVEMQRLVDLGECKMKLKDFSGARRLFDRAAQFPVEEEPFKGSERQDQLMHLHTQAVVRLVELTPMEELHKVFYLPFARQEIIRVHPEKAKKLYTADDATTARFKRRFIGLLELIVDETPPDKALRKHAEGLLAFTRSGAF